MGHLPAAESDRDLDAVAVGDELLRVFELRIEIPDVDARRHPNLFDLHHVLVFSGLFFPLALLEPELAVVHQLAHGGIGLRRNLDQVQALLIGDLQGLRRRHDAELLALGTDQANLLVSDLLVQFMHYFTNGRSTSISESQNADTMQASAQQQTTARWSDYSSVNLFAKSLEVRRMQSAFFVLLD